MNNTSVFTELNKPAVERKKATTIPTIKMVVKRSTALVESQTKAARIKQKIKEPEVELVAMKRYGNPEEVASVISFLCSEDASYVTGQTIEISGGLMM